MELPTRWLIATDGSKYANLSVEYAAELYKFIDPKPNVLIIHVIPDPTDSQSRNPLTALTKEKERGKQILREAKERFEEAAGESETVSTMVAIGEPRQVIVEIAKGNQTDHIIMGGSDYRWKITDLLSGGVSNYILHHMQCVITVIK